MTGSNSVPVERGQREPRNNGRGTSQLHTQYETKQAATEILIAYKWPLVLLAFGGVGLIAYFGLPSMPSIPPEFWMLSGYFVGGVGLAALPSYILLKKWRTPDGIEIMELDPVTGEHRHLRLGRELWEDAIVLSPWGGEANKADLADCRINGRSGYEVTDLRISEDGTPVMAATTVGEMSTSQLRTYRYVLSYVRSRLAERADRGAKLIANREHIIEEAVEQQVYEMVATSEESGLPNGEQIDSMVDDLLDDLGGDLGDDDPDLGGDLRDIEQFESNEQHSNGETETVKDLMQA